MEKLGESTRALAIASDWVRAKRLPVRSEVTVADLLGGASAPHLLIDRDLKPDDDVADRPNPDLARHCGSDPSWPRSDETGDGSDSTRKQLRIDVLRLIEFVSSRILDRGG
jgi:hypothetical protein